MCSDLWHSIVEHKITDSLYLSMFGVFFCIVSLPSTPKLFVLQHVPNCFAIRTSDSVDLWEENRCVHHAHALGDGSNMIQCQASREGDADCNQH